MDIFYQPDLINWLLEDDNPSVRYYSLRHLINRSPSHPEVLAAKRQIKQVGMIPRILEKQNPGGFWEKEQDFYIRTKYKGTVWQLIILAELGADGKDLHIQKAKEFILTWSQDRQSGGFAYQGSEKNGGHHSKVLPCLTGNMVWSLLRFGYAQDPRVQAGIDWITSYQRFDDGIAKKPTGWPYDQFETCWGKHSCIQGIVKGLRALGEIPAAKRNKDVKAFIEQGAEFLLKHHIFKQSHNLDRIARPKWIRFGFPTMWDTDTLEMLNILLDLGYKDDRMRDAVDLVKSKQDQNGQWLLENTYNGRFQFNIERKGKPSKWVTFNALRALKKFYAPV